MKNQNFLSDSQVASRYGIHRVSVWRWVKNGFLPKPVKLSPGCTRWSLDDLLKWEATKGGGVHA